MQHQHRHSDAPAQLRSVFSGTEISVAQQYFEHSYHGHGYRVEETDRPFAFRTSSVGDENLLLRSVALDGAMGGGFVLTDMYVVSWLTSGSLEVSAGSERVDAVQGRPFVIPVDRSCHFRGRDYRESSMLFSARFLEGIAAEVAHGAPGPLRFPLQAATAAQATAWAAVARSVGRVLHDPGATPVEVAHAKRAAAVAVLDLFAPDDLTTMAPAASVRMAGAIEFIHARAHEPITIGDIVAASLLTARGLQDAFRRRLGVTPLEYLRQVRLDRVRDDLQAAADTATVAAIAAGWHFAHPGRFSQYYRQRFGEHPRDTLSRARQATAAAS